MAKRYAWFMWVPGCILVLTGCYLWLSYSALQRLEDHWILDEPNGTILVPPGTWLVDQHTPWPPWAQNLRGTEARGLFILPNAGRGKSTVYSGFPGQRIVLKEHDGMRILEWPETPTASLPLGADIADTIRMRGAWSCEGTPIHCPPLPVLLAPVNGEEKCSCALLSALS